MSDPQSTRPGFSAFAGHRMIARGSLPEVALAVKEATEVDAATTCLVFDDITGTVVDLDLRGSRDEVRQRLGAGETSPEEAKPARGRPKLGVVAREVTLLPRHWEWLGAQPGGASQALRRLVDQARAADEGRSERRMASEAAYRFMAAMAGDLPGFEEASRALFAGDVARLGTAMAGWPEDVSRYVFRLWRTGN